MHTRVYFTEWRFNEFLDYKKKLVKDRIEICLSEPSVKFNLPIKRL